MGIKVSDFDVGLSWLARQNPLYIWWAGLEAIFLLFQIVNAMKVTSPRSHYTGSAPGARFSKVPIINRPVKLILFTCKIEVTIVLHLTRKNEQLIKQNGVIGQPGLALLFFVFRFEYLISGQKSYRDFRSGSFWDWREIKENMPAFACSLLASFLTSVYCNCLLLKAE